METDETLLGRRQALKCLGWAGTGALYALNGGIATSLTLDQAVAGVPPGQRQAATTATFTFLQISDTHVGFAKAANPDPVATLRETVAKIRALPVQPDFLVHTGDISHLAKTEASAGEDHGGGEIARAGSGIGPPRVEQAQQQVEAIALVGAGLVDCRARRKAGGVEQAMQAFQCATP